MKIYLTSATGQAQTELAAFDKALIDAGIANTNLIVLSSVIPPKPEIVFEKPEINADQYGNRLYVVMAQHRASKKGETVAAGIGWVIEENNRFGLFVEHEAESKNAVSKLIKSSLKDMVKNRDEFNFGEIQTLISEIKCTSKPVCALTCAVYKLENW